MEKQIVVARLFVVRPGSINDGPGKTVSLNSPRQLWKLGRHIKDTMRIVFFLHCGLPARLSTMAQSPPWFLFTLTVSMSLYSFHRWNIKSPHTVVLWESWNNTSSNRTVIREKHITNQIPFPDVKCHKGSPPPPNTPHTWQSDGNFWDRFISQHVRMSLGMGIREASAASEL